MVTASELSETVRALYRGARDLGTASETAERMTISLLEALPLRRANNIADDPFYAEIDRDFGRGVTNVAFYFIDDYAQGGPVAQAVDGPYVLVPNEHIRFFGALKNFFPIAPYELLFDAFIRGTPRALVDVERAVEVFNA